MVGPVDKLCFIRAMARDPKLNGVPLRVGIELVEHYNHKWGYAFPSVRTLANILEVTERAVQKATRKLSESGWFEVKVLGGRRHSNRYIPVWKRMNEHSPFEKERANPGSGKGEPKGAERMNQSSPEPSYKEPAYQPTVSTPSADAGKKTGRKRSLPDEWQPDEKAQLISEELGHTDEDRAYILDQFRDHHRANGARMADWDAAFRKWLRSAQTHNQLNSRRKIDGRRLNCAEPARGSFTAALHRVFDT